MTKTEKKIDNNLCKVLTVVCEEAKDEIQGFQWLTHTVNYANFPTSLKITCVFDSNADIAKLMASKQDQRLQGLVTQALNAVDVKLKNISKQVQFDSEENCTRDNAGNWAKRLG
ncbi:Fis family transcriptional regulator [Moritella sp.]|uniref:Fis family transcriptional regulator n=1 Tax=Moritella sp. TaxID=78556 RepID=UPI001D7E2057|nr:Fis family transcriptional regulator [Moritella sp.]MCJ8349431.1 Fis family transcriptional regulator [Moritella sp.]NQZ39253.1 Fis family transcriptional regulator [Moritella sp.]